MHTLRNTVLALLVIGFVVLAGLISGRNAATDVYTGTLQSGIMQFGGETTGVVLTTPTGTYELDLSAIPGGPDAADPLDGAQVTVRGRLRIQQGIEVPERRIIAVNSIEKSPS